MKKLGKLKSCDRSLPPTQARVHRVKEDVTSQVHYILKKSFNSVATEEGFLEQEHHSFIGTFCYLDQRNSTLNRVEFKYENL